VFGHDSTFSEQIYNENGIGIVYLKDGTSLECKIFMTVNSQSVLGKYGIFTRVNCDGEYYEIEQVDKLVYEDGRVKLNKELSKHSIIAKFSYYSITAGLIVLLFTAVS
jgi:hypothetical protein